MPKILKIIILIKQRQNCQGVDLFMRKFPPEKNSLGQFGRKNPKFLIIQKLLTIADDTIMYILNFSNETIPTMSPSTPKVRQKASKEPVKKQTEFWSKREIVIATHKPMLKYPSLGRVNRDIPKEIPSSTDRQTIKMKIELLSRKKF